MTLRQLSFWLILTLSLTECRKPHEKENELTLPDSLITNSASRNAKTKQLVETILNLPTVVKFSKADFIQEKYGTISIYFMQDTIAANISSILQKGRPLKLQHHLDSINAEERPCYVFKKINIKNDEAYVYMVLDITGAIAYGNLKYIDENWLPDKDFLIGVR
jgi:hypothetical protein